MMITVTAVVYAVLIAPTKTLSGFALVTNPLQLIVVPITFVGVVALAPRTADPGRVGCLHARARCSGRSSLKVSSTALSPRASAADSPTPRAKHS